ncbi:LURP-one-related/scramblase family protein [Candidatus Nanohalobium constans]|uniref:LURP-one-related family protein n=1 Tax=Candidatus Nanohalobium constans TaxID=2565781 RepID=A0A5Q0UGE6_9ARCH|nr:LURP-one-related family protein [Candidatus Nanohalobium constans]QGA80280.1 hypothetical protein LC1Nh_0379 [Candidatus Nanohalobium constans]
MTGVLNRIDFEDNSYTVKQKAVRNAYKVYDSAGKEVLRTKQKMFKMKEEFPFTDPEGNEVFTVKAEQIMDIAGDYALTDSETREEVAVLKKNFSFLVHSWEVQDRNGMEIATIQSRGKLIGILRGLNELFDMLPHKYTIEDPQDNQIGTIKQSFTLIKDRYEIDLNEGVENKEAILAAAITIDALEGN